MFHNVCRSIWSWVSWICLPMLMEKWREVWVSPRVKMCSNETRASLPTKPLTSSSERLNCQESRVFLLHERPILMLQLFIMLLSFMMMVSKLKLANASYSSACIMELWQDDNIGVPRRKEANWVLLDCLMKWEHTPVLWSHIALPRYPFILKIPLPANLADPSPGWRQNPAMCVRHDTCGVLSSSLCQAGSLGRSVSY